ETMWFMSSRDFIDLAATNRNGKNIGKRSIWFNGKSARTQSEHAKPKYDPWRISVDGHHDFSRIASYLQTGNDNLAVLP
ncbi:MAG: hypothetical protein WDA23_10930, partial [Gemmobacter sp.]